MKKKHLLAGLALVVLTPLLSACDHFYVEKVMDNFIYPVYVPSCFTDGSYKVERDTGFQYLNNSYSKLWDETTKVIRKRAMNTPYIFFSTIAGTHFYAEVDVPEFLGFQVTSVKTGSSDYTYDWLNNRYNGVLHFSGGTRSSVKKIMKTFDKIEVNYRPVEITFVIEYPGNETIVPIEATKTIDNKFYYGDSLMDISFPTLSSIYGANADLIYLKEYQIYANGHDTFFADKEGRVSEFCSVIDEDFVKYFGGGYQNIYDSPYMPSSYTIYPQIYLKDDYVVYQSDFSFSDQSLSDYNGKLPYEIKDGYYFEGYYTDLGLTHRINGLSDLPRRAAGASPITLYPNYITATQGLEYSDGVVSSDVTGDIIIPDAVNGNKITTLGKFPNAFSVKFNNFITDVEEGAFEGNNNLSTFEWPSKVTSIPANCFNGCREMYEITGLENVTSFGDYCFKNCLKLETIDMPSAEYTLGDSIFERCTSLKHIGGRYTCEGVLYKESMIYCYPIAKTNSSYVFPSYCKYVPTDAFYGRNNLREVIFTSNELTLAAHAFEESKIQSFKTFANKLICNDRSFDKMPFMKDMRLLCNEIQLNSNTFVDSSTPTVSLLNGAYNALQPTLSSHVIVKNLGERREGKDGIYSANGNIITSIITTKTSVRLPYKADETSIAENCAGTNFSIDTLYIGGDINFISNKAFTNAMSLAYVYINSTQFVQSDGYPFRVGTRIFVKGSSSAYYDYVAQWPDYASYIETY